MSAGRGRPRTRSGSRALLPTLLPGLLPGLLWGLVALEGCSAAAKTIRECRAADGVTPICGFRNPEDLATLPGGGWIAVSEFGGPEAVPGRLLAWRVADGRKLTLFGPGSETVGGEARWGDPACPGPIDPARFSPHGIDVDVRSSRLAAVNHGGRESVELFEIGRSVHGPTLVWRGCIVVPEGAMPNDVALLDDGGLLVTRMMSGQGAARLLSGVRLFLGRPTGAVMEWHPGSAWQDVAESEGSAPNGVVATRDGSEIYVAEWGGQRLIRLRRDGDGRVTRDSVDLEFHPDNITWTRDGRLLVTGQRGPLGEVLACNSVREGTCALPFSVVMVGPAALDTRTLLQHEATAMGAGTVALELGRQILIGTFAGDRLARAAGR